jgi:hypothetical protein
MAGRHPGAPCGHLVLTLIAQRRRSSARSLSLARSCDAYNSTSFAATGRGWRHPSFTCRRPTPGRGARWPEIQEARYDRSRRSVNNGAELETAEGHLAAYRHGVRPAGSDPDGRQQLAAWLKDAVDAVPRGNPLGRATAPLWLPSGTRVPVASSPAFAGGACGACGVRKRSSPLPAIAALPSLALGSLVLTIEPPASAGS